jgi:UDP:flavonoid glycosyltransferase YjiC (YdhE family)
MIVPLLLDQFYWGYRVLGLGIGPGSVKMNRISKKQLEKKVLALMTNPAYKENAASLGERIRSENGIDTFCDHIERYGEAAERERA